MKLAREYGLGDRVRIKTRFLGPEAGSEGHVYQRPGENVWVSLKDRALSVCVAPEDLEWIGPATPETLSRVAR